MLFGFKKKYLLKDVLLDNYVDIHSHILPGIDDGADSVETSEDLLKSMRSLGFSRIITTPHTLPNVWDNTTESITGAYTKLIKEKQDLTSQVQLKVASEYFLDNEFLEKTLEQNNLLTLKDNYLLVELSYLNPPIALNEILFAIQMKGYQPVLAHPERYLYYHNTKDTYEALKNAGCLFQLNLLSVVGYYGKGVMETADYLLKNGFIDFTGSDIHHKRHIAAFDRKVMIKSIEALKVAMSKNQFFAD
ncbi:tyrosine-protein phosphatase [Neptunitalea lumnitzerae]|uniref:protein-tyrosine-phosphatase n=1 Tax=Neptunitalea lumnitzerae TaxID=2965509 RepID=A0ABQ5MGZ3_9FLAO|nr:CpsB/CapC family capsule biosynthesis tyrosine phosphatase [Neptunitalea sp. Y10]GLB48674.1 capsular polysaccharide biosynthesis protein [Neptunitalea sp. Y10]